MIANVIMYSDIVPEKIYIKKEKKKRIATWNFSFYYSDWGVIVSSRPAALTT